MHLVLNQVWGKLLCTDKVVVTVIRCVGAGLPDEESLLIFTFHANPASSYNCLFPLLMWICGELGGIGDDRQGSSDTLLPPIPSCYHVV